MKKKLNLLWNLKFNFFSVAERPLTFFAYFLNAKKVGRRRLVISPAKAGVFLFSHTRLPFPPRPLLPFGRISPAAKPGWPVIGPTGADVLPFPSRLRRAGAPTAKPRPLLPFGRISPAAKPGWPVVAPAGGNVLAPPFSLRSNVAPRSHPGPCSRSVAFRLRQNRAGRSSAPPFGVAAQNRARHFAAHSLGGRPLRGHGFAAPHRHFPLPAAAAPTTA